MNLFQINKMNNMNNNFNPEDFQQSYNPYRTVNLMKNKNSTNQIYNSYNRGIVNMRDIIEKDVIKDKNLEENEIIPERSLSNYVNNSFLADAILKLNDIEFYFHKIILCSCSDYINNIFTYSDPEKKNEDEKKDDNEKNKNMAIINIPEIVPSSLGGGNRKQSMEKILKYCYNNQDFKCIESDINQYNIFCLLELAHCLGIKSLKLYLENKIIKNYIDKDNVTKLALESKIFDLQKLNKECISFIIKNFKYIKIFKNDIIDLDYNSFKQIIISDEINIDNEKDISDFVISYIMSRRNLKEEKIEKDNKEEKKEKNEDKKEEVKVEENKEKEKDKEEENKEKKEKENDVNEKWKKYLNELKDSVKKRELSKEEEKELILCIRFNFLIHTELVKLINEPIMNEYKDLLLNALSLKLNSYEETPNNEKSIFNLNPRRYQNQENQENNYYMNGGVGGSNNNPCHSQDMFMNNNSIRMMNNKSMVNTNNELLKNKNNFNNSLNNDYFYKSSDFYNKPMSYIYDNKFNKTNYYNINNNNNYNDNEGYLNRNNEFDRYNYDNNFDNNDDEKHLLNSQYFNIKNKKEKEKINRYREMIKPEKKYIQNKERSSLSSENNQRIYPINYHIKFKYKNDFDKNGVFYYIGTYGLSRTYNNPHELKLIKAFGSSLQTGYYSDFVGRNIVNLCTDNEENSFLGVDLGPDRSLIPTLYSIRNRDSSSNVLLNWCLQGSNDKINYEILDKRIFNSEDNNIKDKYKQYKNLLKEPKTTSTWGISKRIREKFQNGFRYFIIKQIGKNSSGNYNLAISGFELYGEGIGSGWNFS